MKSKRSGLIVFGMIALLLLFISIPMNGQTDPNWRLRYAQVANGVTGGYSVVYTLLVTNAESHQAEFELIDFDHNNPDNWLRTSYTTNCAMPEFLHFIVPPNSTCRFDSDGVGTLETGWVRIDGAETAHGLGGYLTYTYYLGNPTTGTPAFTIGVSPLHISHEFSVPVLRDAPRQEDTAFAMVNPWFDRGIQMMAYLYNSNGTLVDSKPLSLAHWGHMALFLSELFPSTLGSAVHFIGNMVVRGTTSEDSAVSTVLLQRRSQYGGATATHLEISLDKSSREVEPRGMKTPPRDKIIRTAWSPLY